jgi:hypothetical protein
MKHVIKVNEPVEFVPVTELSEKELLNILLKSIWADDEFVASKPAAK